jgi:hypothetical protein
VPVRALLWDENNKLPAATALNDADATNT